jgi:hypothetical protein
MTESVLERLVHSLSASQLLDPEEDQITALLAWLGGSTRDPNARFLRSRLGAPGEDESIRAAAFEQLDIALFDNDQLLVKAAGVGNERDERERRRRFRLLLSVFHPDRYPARAEWLTSRLQIVNKAYADFKAGRSDVESAAGTLDRATPSPQQRRTAPQAWQGITPSWTMGERLFSRLGRDRYLAHKIISVLVLVIALPVISILLDSQSDPLGLSSDDEPERIEDRWFGRDLDLVVDEWPLVSPEPEWLVVAKEESVEAGPVDEVAEWPDDIEVSVMPEWLGLAQVGGADDSVDRTGDVNIEAVLEMVEFVQMVRNAVLVEELEVRDEVEVVVVDPVEDMEDAGDAVMEDEPVEVLVVDVGGEDDEDRVVAGLVEEGEFLIEDGVVVGLETSGMEPRPAGIETLAPVEAEEEVELKPGTLSLGLLGNHQVGNVLTEYRDSVEAGDLDGVLRVMGRRPRENENQGQSWFEQRYGELFDSSHKRALSMHVRHVRRTDNEWLVEVDYRLEMEPVGSDEFERLEREVRYLIAPDPFRLRIVSVEY